jgi:hypothetical protein
MSLTYVKRLTTSTMTAICINKYFIRVLVRSRQGGDMKVWRYVVFSLMVSFVILGGGICYQVEADEGLPDGFKILKEKMEKNEIPNVDFTQFKFFTPGSVPDEINNLKGYLWSGKLIHPAYIAHKEGPIAYLFLVNYNKETGDITIFYTFEAGEKTKPGRAALRGKVGTEDKGKIELKTGDGSPFTLMIKDKEHLILRSGPSGRDADMKKIGTISSPPK